MMPNDMNKSQRHRLKDLDGYREKKREYAKTDAQRKKRREYMRKWNAANRERVREIARESYARRKDDPDYKELRRSQVLRNAYGFSVAQWNAMLEAQGGVCAICKRPQADMTRRLHVDHDHDTGTVRGLLCSACNTKLGWLETFGVEIRKYVEEDRIY